MLDQNEDEEFESLGKKFLSDAAPTGNVDGDIYIVTSKLPIDMKGIAWQQESSQ